MWFTTSQAPQKNLPYITRQGRPESGGGGGNPLRFPWKKSIFVGFFVNGGISFFWKDVCSWVVESTSCLKVSLFFFLGHPPENEKAHPAVHGKKTENPPLKRAGDCSLPEGYRSLRLWMCKKCRQWRMPAKELLTYWEVLRRPLSLEMCGVGLGT